MSIVMQCLEAASVDLSRPLPTMEAAEGIRSILDMCMGDGHRAKKLITSANKLFKKGYYKEAERQYREAKTAFSEIRKRMNGLKSTTLNDFVENTAYFFTLFNPLGLLLIHIPALIKESSMVGDSKEEINSMKIWERNKNSTNVMRNYIVALCDECEQACDDKIKRCRSGN